MDNYNFEYKNNENTTAENVAPTDNQENGIKTYGAVYTPNSNGHGYSCHK